MAAVAANPLDLYHLADCRKAKHCCLFADQSIDLRIIQLCHGAALATNQELPGMRATGITTTHECVKRVQPVHQICLDKKFQCSINRWRSRPPALAI